MLYLVLSVALRSRLTWDPDEECGGGFESAIQHASLLSWDSAPCTVSLPAESCVLTQLLTRTLGVSWSCWHEV